MLSSEERNWVSEQLPSPHLDPEPTDKDIARIAQALLQRRAEAEVRELVGEMRTTLHASKVAQELSWFQFAGPLPKGTEELAPVTLSDGTVKRRTARVLQEGESVKVLQAVVRPAYKVYLPKLEAFCKEHGLDPKAMHEVGMGTRKEHKGFIRCPWNLGVNGMLGQPWKDPSPPEAFDPEAPNPRTRKPKWVSVRPPEQPKPVEYR